MVYFNEQLPVQIWIMFFFLIVRELHEAKMHWASPQTDTYQLCLAVLSIHENIFFIPSNLIRTLVKWWPELYWGFTLFCIHTFNIDFIMDYNQTLWIGAQYFGTFRTFGFEFQEVFDNMLTCHLSLLILKWAKRQVSLFSQFIFWFLSQESILE